MVGMRGGGGGGDDRYTDFMSLDEKGDIKYQCDNWESIRIPRYLMCVVLLIRIVTQTFGLLAEWKMRKFVIWESLLIQSHSDNFSNSLFVVFRG